MHFQGIYWNIWFMWFLSTIDKKNKLFNWKRIKVLKVKASKLNCGFSLNFEIKQLFNWSNHQSKQSKKNVLNQFVYQNLLDLEYPFCFWHYLFWAPPGSISSKVINFKKIQEKGWNTMFLVHLFECLNRITKGFNMALIQ